MMTYPLYQPPATETSARGSQPVTDNQRARAQAWLQAAYADGKLSASEYDARVGRVWLAQDRAQLNSVFEGLIAQPAAHQSVAVRPTVSTGSPLAAALPYLLWIPTGFVGSLIIWALSARGSTVRREAARAFNFQLVGSVLMVIANVLADHGVLRGMANGLGGLIWLGITIVSVIVGVRILKGHSSASKIVDATPLKVLKG